MEQRRTEAPTSLTDGLHGGVQEAGGAPVGIQVDDVIALLLPSHLIHQHAGERERETKNKLKNKHCPRRRGRRSERTE